MAAKKSPQKDQQQERFASTAKELGVELDEDKLKQVLRKIAKPEKEPED